MSSITFDLSRTSSDPGWNPDLAALHDALWRQFMLGASYTTQTTSGLQAITTLAGQGMTFDSALGDIAFRRFAFADGGGTIGSASANAPSVVTLDWTNDASATLRLDRAWNTIKNAEISAFTGTSLRVENFVDAWVRLADDIGRTITLEGAKRGEVTTGAGSDTISIGIDSNNPGWTNEFLIDAGGGNDLITFRASQANWVGGVYDGKWTSTTTRAGAGNDTIIGWGSDDIVDGGSGFDIHVLRGLRGGYTITTVAGVTTIVDTTASDGKDGRDRLTQVERIVFGDGSVLDLEGPPPNAAPIAADDTAMLEAALAGGVLGTIDVTAELLDNDVDPEAQPLIVVGVGPATLGSVALQGGAVLFTIDDALYRALGAGEQATGSFTYTVQDAGGLTDTATATIVVVGVNDAASITGTTAGAVVEDSTATIAGTLSVADVDAGEAVFAVPASLAGLYGTFTFDAATGDWGYALANAAANVQSLAAGTEVTDSLVVASRDGTATATITVTIAGALDAPAVQVAPASGDALSASIPLSIAASLTDIGGTATLQSLTISGVPSAYALSAGTQDENGDWTVTPAELNGLALVPANGATGLPGVFTLQVTATALDASGQASVTTPLAVTVAAAANQQTGQVIDGYIAGATVFADANANGILDGGEASATTNADGSFTLTGGSGALVMFGGTDTSTGVAFAGTLTAPAGASVITPLTTLVVAIAGAGATQPELAAAQAAILAALGLPGGIDLATYDPVAATLAGDPDGAAVLAAGVQVQATVTQVAAAVGSTAQSVVDALATALEAGAPIDLADSAVIGGIVTTVAPGADPTAVGQVGDVVAAANASVADAAAGGLAGIAQAAQVALGATADALAAAGLDTTALATVVADSTGAALDAQVAAAPVGDVDGPTIGTIGKDTLTGGGDIDAIDGLDDDDQLDGAGGADLLYGGAGRDTLTGGAGNDALDGGTGFDSASYRLAAEGVSVSLATGIVTGGASVGIDTLARVEAILGSAFADTYDAVGYTFATGVAPGANDQGSVNEFEGGGGDDTIIGNGATGVSYRDAAAGVSVNLVAGIAAGIAPGDLAGIGTDSIVGGVTAIRGSAFDDTLVGTANPNVPVENFDGGAGNDFIDGNGGTDRARYDTQSTGALGITVDFGAGIVTGRDAAATAVVGIDTLRNIDFLRATNADDILDARSFTAVSANNGGEFGNFAEFEGMGGNDTIFGNGNTRLSFAVATAGVLVDMSASGVGLGQGFSTGNASVGTDTISGVNALRGSAHDDTLIGSNNGTVGQETYEGYAGNDLIDGGLGFDRVRYDNNALPIGSSLVLGIQVSMAAGIVTGRDATALLAHGTDTLRAIETVRGTNVADIYDATGFGLAGALNIGNNGTLNEFEGMGGDDIITGNGNTRLVFGGALGAVSVTFTAPSVGGGATGVVVGGSSIGMDSFTGVSAIRGTGFADSIVSNAAVFATLDGQGGNDTISGGGSGEAILGAAGNDSLNGNGGNDTITGGVGADVIDGGGGVDMAVFNSTRAASTLGFTAGNVSQVAGPTDGTDALSGIELLRFNDGTVLGAATVSLVGYGGLANGNPVYGTATSETLTIGNTLGNSLFDLGGGADTIVLGAVGAVTTLNAVNVETVLGAGGSETLTVTSVQNGTTIDMGSGLDTLALNGFGANTVTVRGVKTLTAGGGNDVVTFFKDPAFSNVTINLGFGTNALTLGDTGAAVTAVSVANTQTITGSSGDDNVTLTTPTGATIDLAGGTNTVTIAGGTYNLALTNVANLVAIGGTETLFLANAAVGMTIDMGLGPDTLNANSGGNQTFTAIGVETLFTGNGIDIVDFVVDAAVVNQLVNLGGGANTLTLLGAGGAMTLSLSGGSTLSVYLGTDSGSEDLTLLNGQLLGTTYDFGEGGADVLRLATNAFGNQLTVRNLETLVGSGSNDNIVFEQDALAAVSTIDLGLGTDALTLANSSGPPNDVRVANTEFITGSAQDDTVTLTTGGTVSVNLGAGANTVRLDAGDATYTLTLTDVGELVSLGTASETVFLVGTPPGLSVNLGGGIDAITLTIPGSALSVANVESVLGTSANDTITILGNNANVSVVTGGGGVDTLSASAGVDHFRFTAAADSPTGLSRDQVVGFDGAADMFVFEGMTGVPGGFAGQVAFVGTDAFLGGGVSSARLTVIGGRDVLQIDVDGAGALTGNDMEIELVALTSTLSDANFLVL